MKSLNFHLFVFLTLASFVLAAGCSKNNNPASPDVSTPTAESTYTSTESPVATGTGTFTATITPTGTSTYTQTVTETATDTFTVTETAEDTPTHTPTVTQTSTVTVTDTETATETYTDTFTVTPTVTLTVTETDTETATLTHTLTATLTDSPTCTSTLTHTITQTSTDTPTTTPTFTHTNSPTNTPTSTFTPDLTATMTTMFVGKFSSTGIGANKWMSCRGIGLDSSGYIYIADDTTNACVAKLDQTTGNVVAQFKITGFTSPYDVAVDGSGNMYVSNYNGKQVAVLDGAGAVLRTITCGGGMSFHAVYSDGTLLMPDFCLIRKYDSTGGQLYSADVYTAGGSCSSVPSAATDSAGNNVFIVASDAKKVRKFNSSLTYQNLEWTVGTGGTPLSIVMDSNGYLYVLDNFQRRITKYDQAGNQLMQFGSRGSGDGQFETPLDMAADGSGNIYISDSGNSRITKLHP